MGKGEGLEGKNVLVIFQDLDRANKREGICTKFDSLGIFIDNKDFIPENKIIRIEVLFDGNP